MKSALGGGAWGSLPWMLRNLALVYGTAIVIDLERRIEMRWRTVEVNFGRKRMREWQLHEDRQLASIDQLRELRSKRREERERLVAGWPPRRGRR